MATEINFTEAKDDTVQEFDIVETKEWKDRNTGMTVLEHIPLKTDTDKHSLDGDKPIVHYGKAQVQIPQMGPMGFQFIFPEEYDLMDCFKHFEEYAQKAIDEMEAEANN